MMDNKSDCHSTRQEWEGEVAELLTNLLGIPRDTAVPVIRARSDMLERYWSAGAKPWEVARDIAIEERGALMSRNVPREPQSAEHALLFFSMRPMASALAARMVQQADVGPDDAVLEPSCGAGHLIAEIRRNNTMASITGVEVEPVLAGAAQRRFSNGGVRIEQRDFLHCKPDTLGVFQRVLMYPPCGGGVDVRHVLHALRFLDHGARLVALCEDGAPQRSVLRPIALGSGGAWDELSPADVALLGAGVDRRFALLCIEA
jgi:hypothetical protein